MIDSQSNPAFIEAQVQSMYIQESLEAHLLPMSLYRNVTDFTHGTTLAIPTVGDVTLQEVEEDNDVTFNPIESGEVFLTITDFAGDAYYITDKQRQDGFNVEALLSARSRKGVQAIAQHFETRMLEVLNGGQTPANPNTLNGRPHRYRASGTNDIMTINDLIDMKLAFNKAYAPKNGRIALVDSVTAAAFEKQAQLFSNLNVSSPLMQELLVSGFMKEHEFVTNIHGWHIFTSEMLPEVSAETLAEADGSGSGSTSGIANIFMCVGDESITPAMMAWRQPPKVETGRDILKGSGRDLFKQTYRFGAGIQRKDTLGVIVTSATATV